MQSKLARVGLALIALAAIGGWGAGSAAAEVPITFTSDSASGKTTITADTHGGEGGRYRFTYGQLTYECEMTAFKGTIGGSEVGEVTITPTYAGCTLSGAEVIVQTNGCHYGFVGTTVAGHGQIYVNCPEGEQIDLVIPALGNCMLTIATQTATDGATYTNEGGDVTIGVTAEFQVTRHNPGVNTLCAFLLPPGGYTTLIGQSLWTGFKDTGGAYSENGNANIAAVE